MSENVEVLKRQIYELSQELESKENQLNSYKHQLRKTNQQLEKMIIQWTQELKIASQLQKILSPTELPQISGFEFSNKFVPGILKGGDYFDIYEHEDRLKFGLVMSCASGYSMSALFLSVLIKISSRIESKKGMQPHEIILKLFKDMETQLGPQDVGSLFISQFDKRTYELKYCLVGNILAVKKSPSALGIQKLHPNGEALKLKVPWGDGLNLETGVINLDARDKIIICSEGVLQAEDLQKNPFGEFGVLEAIRAQPKASVHEVRNEILYRLEKHIGKSEPERDWTVLVMEVKDGVIKLANPPT